jgi:hypothetical protein
VSDYSTMGDAAYVGNLNGTSFDAVAGYLPSVNAFHSWSAMDWAKISGPKLPIFVAPFGNKDGKNDGQSIVSQLQWLKVTPGCPVVVDMETMVDVTYIEAMWRVVRLDNGHKLFVYGSADTVFGNPPCNGYWIADYTGVEHMYDHVSARATQWTSGPKYDSSLVKPWVMQEFWV